MQITVDTNKDSPEDIRKVIALLSAMQDKNYSRVRKPSKNIFDDPTLEISSDPAQSSQKQSSSEGSSDAFANMFASSDNSSSSQSASESSSGSVMNIFDNPPSGGGDDEPDTEEEKADEDVEIIPY